MDDDVRVSVCPCVRLSVCDVAPVEGWWPPALRMQCLYLWPGDGTALAGQLRTAERGGTTDIGIHRFLCGTDTMGVCLVVDWGYGFWVRLPLGENMRLREEWARAHGLLLLLPKNQRWTWNSDTDTITLAQDGGIIDKDFELNSKRLCTVVRYLYKSLLLFYFLHPGL
jgi:hypothetical protein